MITASTNIFSIYLLTLATRIDAHLHELIGMARPFSVGQWEHYYDLVNRTFPKINTTMLLPFDEAESK